MKLRNYNDYLLRQAPGEPAGGAPAEPAAPAAPVAPAAGPDLSFIPSDFHTDGAPDLGKFSTHYQEIVARDAQRAEAEAAAAATVPEGDYAFALPEDLKFDGIELPEGFKFDLMTEDEQMKPLFTELSGWMKGHKMPAAASTELMTLLAKYQATQYAQAVAAQNADLSKLGTPAQVSARIETLSRVIAGRVPADEAAALKAMTTSATALRALERLIGPSSGATPQPAPPGASREGLTAYERLKLANSGGR